MEERYGFGEKEYMACCGSTRFAKLMLAASPFPDFQHALDSAKDIWFNKVDVNGWLEAFSAHPQIGEVPSSKHHNDSFAQWSKGEQSTAFATATDSTLQELAQWNVQYRQKFGFVFLIFASGRSSPEILTELKRRYSNRPIVELENAAQEQMKITELRLSKLFSTKQKPGLISTQLPASVETKAGEDRVGVIGAHLTATSEAPAGKPSAISSRSRPPITTHVLDVAHGSPASGIDVLLEMWSSNQSRPNFGGMNTGNWVFLGSSTTDKDGRSGQLMSIVDAINPGIYRISFNTGNYCPDGFFPYVSIVFEIREHQKLEHFHVPLLLSPFSFTTYRGS
ncbi:Transthyretin/hydroxyisourate hydrolase domain [Dillenia turbinata]|uniref:Transthyretin/hydroxyisourate hydrolase domain n=1 Tax=Dillenia turbinata TaxID=194707 RepID=A0AAN8YYG9_9MAGN